MFFKLTIFFFFFFTKFRPILKDLIRLHVWIDTSKDSRTQGNNSTNKLILLKNLNNVKFKTQNISIILFIYLKKYFNIGRSFWEFSSRFRLVRRGRLTDYRIPPHVMELTTVFLSNYNNKTYLIEYERFWRFDEATGKMDKGYPKDMSAWRYLPYPVDAAIIWKGGMFFFKLALLVVYILPSESFSLKLQTKWKTWLII